MAAVTISHCSIVPESILTEVARRRAKLCKDSHHAIVLPCQSILGGSHEDTGGAQNSGGLHRTTNGVLGVVGTFFSHDER